MLFCNAGDFMKKMSLISLSWPILIEALLFMMLGFVDVFALSRYDDLASASVGTANQVASICNLLFSVTSTASAIIIAQNLGAKNRAKATQTAALSIFFNFMLGLIVSLVLVFFNRPMLSALGAKGKVLSFGSEYLVIVGGFMFGQAVINSINVIFRSHGYTRIPMYITVVMNVLNTVLDLTFVFGWFGLPVLGVKGVAIATTFSKIVGAVILVIIFFKKIEKPSMFKMLFPFPFRDFGLMLKVGIPAAFESINYNLSQLIITSIALRFMTDNEYITRSYTQNITSVFYIFSLSIGQGAQILTSHYVGAKEYDKAYRELWKSLLLGYGLTAVMCTIGVVFRHQLVGIFTDNPEVIAIGGNLIIINVILEVGRCTNLIVINSLRGAGDVFFPTGAAIFSMWVISTLGSYILVVVCGWGIYGMWIALTADECFRAVLMIFRWKNGKWRGKSLAASAESAEQTL